MRSPNNPSFSYDIYGGIDEAVDAAYARNAEAAPGANDAFNRMFKTPDTLADNHAVHFMGSVSESLETNREIFRCRGVYIPRVREFIEAGVDFNHLYKAHTRMQDLGLEPQLVFAPILSVIEWEEVYGNLMNGQEIRSDCKPGPGRSGLFIPDVISDRWNTFAEDVHSTSVHGRRWQIALLPTTTQPTLSEHKYYGSNVESGSKESLELTSLRGNLADVRGSDATMLYPDIHPTLATYLTLQAARLQSGKYPLDFDAGIWLSGMCEYMGNTRMLSGFWDSDEKEVSIMFDADQNGVRLPVWAEQKNV